MAINETWTNPTSTDLDLGVGDIVTEDTWDKMISNLNRLGGTAATGGVAVRAYCRITTAGTLVANSFNVASVTDTFTGNRSIVIDNDMANTNYVPISTLTENPASTTHQKPIHDTFAVGSVRLLITNGADFIDLPSATLITGDQ